MKISICIPTYNREQHLSNCLNSIALNQVKSNIDYEVCISDNCSSDNTLSVVEKYNDLLPLKYHKNSENLGIPRNFLNVVNMASGDFIWLLGDDDLLLPNALNSLSKLINANNDVDYFYINSFHLTTEYIMSYPQPFNISNLPSNMTPFSSWSHSGKYSFLELIDPKISFDFLGGMFLSVFRKKLWDCNISVLNQNALIDKRTFSHFDNTFPHVKIFSSAFAGKKAYFNATPLSVCLSGAREWAPMYPFIRSIRIPEALIEYKRNGLKYIKYWQCKNFILQTFIPDLVYMLIYNKISGIQYVSITKHVISNIFYPNVYLSLIYFVFRRVLYFIKR